jgi:hypothetical protein
MLKLSGDNLPCACAVLKMFHQSELINHQRTMTSRCARNNIYIALFSNEKGINISGKRMKQYCCFMMQVFTIMISCYSSAMDVLDMYTLVLVDLY